MSWWQEYEWRESVDTVGFLFIAASVSSTLPPHLVLLILWQRDRKCPLTLRRNVECSKRGASYFCVPASFCLCGDHGWVECGAVEVRCPTGSWIASWERLQCAVVLLCYRVFTGGSRSCHERHTWPTVLRWEMCNGRLGLGVWFWVCQRERGITFVLSEPTA